MRTENLPTALLIAPANPHRLDYDPDEMLELENSIRTQGLINAVLVKPAGDLYEIVAGHRRWIAHKNLRLPTIRCTIDENSTAGLSQLQQIAENFDRANLTPMEEALAISALAKQYNDDLASVARAIHRTPGFVARRLQLLEMHAELKEMVHTKQLPIESALLLAQIADDAHRLHLLTYTTNSGASVPVVREWVNQYLRDKIDTPLLPPTLPPAVVPGQLTIVLLPCFLCGTPLPYQTLRIKRCCAHCDDQVATAARSQPTAVAT